MKSIYIEAPEYQEIITRENFTNKEISCNKGLHISDISIKIKDNKLEILANRYGKANIKLCLICGKSYSKCHTTCKGL